VTYSDTSSHIVTMYADRLEEEARSVRTRLSGDGAPAADPRPLGGCGPRYHLSALPTQGGPGAGDAAGMPCDCPVIGLCTACRQDGTVLHVWAMCYEPPHCYAV